MGARFPILLMSGAVLLTGCQMALDDLAGPQISDPLPTIAGGVAPSKASETTMVTDAKKGAPAKATPDKADAPVVADATAAKSSIEKLIESRQADYDAVMQEARQRGALGGAIQGGLIGLVASGTTEGAFGGAVIGAMVGDAVGVETASQLVREHRNYLIRRLSLEAVIDAARKDTKNTRFDLLLSDQAVMEFAPSVRASAPGTPEAAPKDALTDFKRHAQMRALALREIMPIYQDDAEGYRALRELLTEQVKMLGRFEDNVETLNGQ